MSRFYAIKHKTINKYVTGFVFSGRGKKSHWELTTLDRIFYLDIDGVNSMIQRAVHYKVHNLLDDYEIENFERVFKQIKGTVRMKTVRNRIEQRAIMAALKRG